MKKQTKNTQSKKAQKKTEDLKSSTKEIKENVKVPVVKGVLDVFGMWEAFKISTKPQKRLLINMEFTNGQHTSFYTLLDKQHFTYKKGTYVIDTEYMYYNINLKTFALDYHEALSLPIKRTINPEQIKKAIANHQKNKNERADVFEALNPYNLTMWQKSTIIEKVLNGADLDKLLKFIKLVSIIGLIVGLINFAILGDYTGIFNSINII